MRRNTKRILFGSTIAAGALTAAGATSLALTNKLVKLALDRELPHGIKDSDMKLSGSDNERTDIEHYTAAIEKLEARPHKLVTINARDGEKLIGHLFSYENAKRTILAMHGWRSSWSGDFALIADFWLSEGCNVLFVEQRGQNNSGGDCMGFGLLERHDCLEWIKYLNKNGYSSLPIYLCGISMGATTVLMATGLELPENVRGVCADCGFTSPSAIWKHVLENNLHLRYDRLRRSVANNICKQRLCGESTDYSTVDALKTSRIPVLLIHGTDDKFVPISMTFENCKACRIPPRLLVVPGADHGMSYILNKDGYEQITKDFFRENDPING
jgi:pimeloyl-ACP methyl ester carboxylesterase